MQTRLPLLLVLSAMSAQLLANEPSLGPAIEGYGPTYPIDDRDVRVEEGAVYRAVFDVAAYSDDLTSLNTHLVSVARFLNMHARNGVATESMELAVVLHGAAFKSVLNNDAYQARYDVDNPNLELVMKLHEAGVRFYVCGQSMAFGGFEKSELASPAKIALSAMTMLTVLQTEGYALLR
ncbi:MAG: DsrE family protein [Gammaproteobacteria bacterium]|nr:DsrE family protein [Gammaproteobacteria bacterium]MDH3750899.1 DsrE family protein [Gammaproteobacteria bacterium]